LGLPSKDIYYLVKDIVQIPVAMITVTNQGTKAEAILMMIEDGYTAVPF
jgi:hypothetical protein